MKKFSEIFRFVIAGGVCFLIELICLVFTRDFVGLHTLVATPIAFLVSVVINYILCVSWVFESMEDQNLSVKAGFITTSIMGLLLNELLMWLFGMLFGEDQTVVNIFTFTVSMYMLNKIWATLIVMIWNFITKKKILSSKTKNRKEQKDDL